MSVGSLNRSDGQFMTPQRRSVRSRSTTPSSKGCAGEILALTIEGVDARVKAHSPDQPDRAAAPLPRLRPCFYVLRSLETAVGFHRVLPRGVLMPLASRARAIWRSDASRLAARILETSASSSARIVAAVRLRFRAAFRRPAAIVSATERPSFVVPSMRPGCA